MKTLLEIFNQKPEAKEKFVEWYYQKEYEHNYNISDYYISSDDFFELPFPFQQGVVLEFLREQGLYVDIAFDNDNEFVCYGFDIYKKNIPDGSVESYYPSNEYYCASGKFSKSEPLIDNFNPALLQAIEKSIELL